MPRSRNGLDAREELAERDPRPRRLSVRRLHDMIASQPCTEHRRCSTRCVSAKTGDAVSPYDGRGIIYRVLLWMVCLCGLAALGAFAVLAHVQWSGLAGFLGIGSGILVYTWILMRIAGVPARARRDRRAPSPWEMIPIVLFSNYVSYAFVVPWAQHALAKTPIPSSFVGLWAAIAVAFLISLGVGSPLFGRTARRQRPVTRVATRLRQRRDRPPLRWVAPGGNHSR